MVAREVMPGILEVLFPRPLVHAFVVIADVPTLIDTGTPGGAGTIERALRQADLGLLNLEQIIVTHAHVDHAGNATEIARRSGAEVHVSPGTAPFISRGLQQAKPRAATLLGRAMVPYVTMALPWSVEPVEVKGTLVEGARIGPFRVLETPGHQVGHISLLWEERGVLFTADAAANITRVGQLPLLKIHSRLARAFDG